MRQKTWTKLLGDFDKCYQQLKNIPVIPLVSNIYIQIYYYTGVSNSCRQVQSWREYRCCQLRAPPPFPPLSCFERVAGARRGIAKLPWKYTCLFDKCLCVKTQWHKIISDWFEVSFIIFYGVTNLRGNGTRRHYTYFFFIHKFWRNFFEDTTFKLCRHLFKRKIPSLMYKTCLNKSTQD